MFDNATDPLLFASQRYDSADIIELCMLFLQNVYLKNYGRTRLFVVLQAEHERHHLNARFSIRLLAILLTITWFLQSPIYEFIARSCCALMSYTLAFIARLRSARQAQIRTS